MKLCVATLKKTVLLLSAWVALQFRSAAMQHGFVYCPAYPCSCEAKDGALSINCENLYLSNLPKFLSYNGRIKEMSLRHNSIRRLASNSFKGLHMERLDLLDNTISEIDDNAFSGLESTLQALSIQLYAMVGLPIVSLSTLKNLKILIIEGCKVSELNWTMFEGLPNLEELHLISCRISTIEPSSPTALKLLKNLVLRNNALRHTDLAQFNNLDSLEEIDLSFNNIDLLDNLAFSKLRKLRRLGLASNKIAYIANNAFENLDYSLEDLDLQKNRLKSQSLQSISILKRLRLLDVSHNNISSISLDQYFKDLFRLVQLNLAHNSLNVISRTSFKGLGLSLTHLDLRENPLEVLDHDCFGGLNKLEYLNLRGANLGESLDVDTFSDVKDTLSRMDVSKTNLTDQDFSAFVGFTNLSFADFSDNLLSSVDKDVFMSWRHIQVANFSNNRISHFLDKNVSTAAVHLTSLDLSSNVISKMPPCLFFYFPKLNDLHLDVNPLDCSCAMSWLYRWAEVTKLSSSKASWRCHSPRHLRYTSFEKLEEKHFQCQRDNNKEKHTGGLPLCDSNRIVRYEFETKESSSLTTVSSLLTATAKQDRFAKGITLNITKVDQETIRVTWKADCYKDIGSFIVTLTNANDSYSSDSVTVSANVSQMDLTTSYENDIYEICVTVLRSDNVFYADKCSYYWWRDEEQETVRTQRNEMKTRDFFIPLLLIYISGSLAIVFLIICIALCIRRNLYKSRETEDTYPPGYSAWHERRPSIASLPLTTGTSRHFESATAADDALSLPCFPTQHPPRPSGSQPTTHSNVYSQNTLPTLNLPLDFLPTPARAVTPAVSRDISSMPRPPSSVNQGQGPLYNTLNSSHTRQSTYIPRLSETGDEFYFHF